MGYFNFYASSQSLHWNVSNLNVSPIFTGIFSFLYVVLKNGTGICHVFCMSENFHRSISIFILLLKYCTGIFRSLSRFTGICFHVFQVHTISQEYFHFYMYFSSRFALESMFLFYMSPIFTEMFPL